MRTYTEAEVLEILVMCQLFSNANNYQGLIKVKGENYGDRAITLLNAYKNNKPIEKR